MTVENKKIVIESSTKIVKVIENIIKVVEEKVMKIKKGYEENGLNKGGKSLKTNVV